MKFVRRSTGGIEAAVYPQNMVNTHAEDGWEFYRIDTIGVSVKPGCFDALIGKKNVLNHYYVISLRKPR